jgi:predicted metal-binding membrane protein
MGRPDPAQGVASAATRPLFDRLIANERAIVAIAVAAATALAWSWLVIAPPGGHDMGGMAGMDGMAMRPDPAAAWSAAYLAVAFFMWALMMVAMMLPSAAPMILLYSRFARRAAPRPAAYTAAFVLAYLAIWTLFSVAAATAQAALVSAGIVSAMTLAVGDMRLAGALLLLAGLYQLSPFKRACLDRCRSPLSFIMRRSRPGPSGALRLGLAHGLYCLGCCWALMALLFVGGVMDLAWIAGLALLVLAEKVAPGPWMARRLIGGGLLVAGALLLVAPGLLA